MQNYTEYIDFFEAPMRVSVSISLHSLLTLTRLGVSYHLFHPSTEKGNVVSMKSEVQIKRVGHALHKKTTYQGCEYKSSSQGILEGKRVCSEERFS